MNDFLMHYGIQGMHWGIRRFQNQDGSLTEEGKTRYKNIKNGGRNGAKVQSTVRHRKDIDGTEYEQKINEYSQLGKNSARQSVDLIADKKDYKAAYKLFDSAGMLAVSAYKKGGKEAAFKMLSNGLKDFQYKMTLNDEKRIKDNDSYVTFALNVYGNKYIYSTYGEDNYTDDQKFTKR